jgi:hypothetical protein
MYIVRHYCSEPSHLLIFSIGEPFFYVAMRMQVSDSQNVGPEAVLLTDAGLAKVYSSFHDKLELECFSELQMMVIFRSL